MSTSTHWTAFPDAERWRDNPDSTPEAAARSFLAIGPVDDDDVWHVWDSLQDDERVDIAVHGYIETTELIPDEAQQFDGYEPGQEWFKPTGETKTMRVSLKYEVRP